MVSKILFSSETDLWETPQKLFDYWNSLYKFDFDVCANKYNRKCANYFDIDRNGLLQEWYGNCWMNPPYGKNIGKWVEKAYKESQKNAQNVVCLLPVRSDTKWWHEFVMKAYYIYFIKGRLKFVGSKNSAPFPSCVVIFNKMDDNPQICSYIS